MESITPQCPIGNLFWQETGDKYYTYNRVERGLCGIVLMKLTRAFAAFDRGLNGSHNGRHINSAWKSQMSTLFITAPQPCKRNNWSVHLLSPANVHWRGTKMVFWRRKNIMRNAHIVHIFMLSTSSLSSWTLVPSLLVVFEGQQRRKMQHLDLSRWVCFCPKDHVFKCFQKNAADSSPDMSLSTSQEGVLWTVFLTSFSWCRVLFFLLFFSLEASPLISSLCNFPPQ